MKWKQKKKVDVQKTKKKNNAEDCEEKQTINPRK